MANAERAADFINSLGVNTHLGETSWGAYGTLSAVESALKYLGLPNIRDAVTNPNEPSAIQQVANATGDKFDLYLGPMTGNKQTNTQVYQFQIGQMESLAAAGVVNFLEGGNEPDNFGIATTNAPKPDYTAEDFAAQYQQTLYAEAQKLGLPTIDMSFGVGWTNGPNSTGDYNTASQYDLTNYSDYANAHTYPQPGQTPQYGINRLNGDAQLAANKPVITTEIGWDTANFTPQTAAQYVVDAAFDGMKDGDVKMYYYALYDDPSPNLPYGLMNADGTPRPAGQALHDLTTLLSDTGSNAATFTTGSLTTSLTGNNGDVILGNAIEKSDGSFWVPVWDETGTPTSVTLNVGTVAGQISVFDPVTGTTAVETATNASSITLNFQQNGGNALDPLLVEVSGTTAPSPNPQVNLPSPVTLEDSATANIDSIANGATTYVSISDPWAAQNPGNLALNLSVSSGTITMFDGANPVSGSGTGAISFSGSLAELNADLKTLQYTGPANGASDTLTVNVWDQAGVQTTSTLAVTTSGSPTSADLSVTLPISETLAAGGSLTVAHVTINDPWAAGTPGTMALNLSDSSGTLSMDNNGTLVAGSGTNSISFNGSLSQLNADLATLSYTAPASGGSDSITVDVWNQGGVEYTRSIAVTATGTSNGAMMASAATPASTAPVTPTTTGTGADTMSFVGGVTGSQASGASSGAQHAWGGAAMGDAMSALASPPNAALDFNTGRPSVSVAPMHTFRPHGANMMMPTATATAAGMPLHAMSF